MSHRWAAGGPRMRVRQAAATAERSLGCDDRTVTDEQAGRLIAAVRRRLRLRQEDVGRVAGVDQKVVSLLENGRLERVSVERFRKVCAALGIEPALELRWRGGQGDRLVDRDHARIVEAVVAELTRLGWETTPEFTFNVFGERGSVDVLAWHPVGRALLVIEVKTRLTDLQRLLMSMSRKLRLVPPLVAEQRGWKRAALGHVVVILDSRSNRSTVAGHEATFAATFPFRTARVRAWFRAPVGDLAGLWFVALRREPHPEEEPVQRIAAPRARGRADAPSRRASGS
jgi:transcriptional regulator with XRE-family HTH domain